MKKMIAIILLLAVVPAFAKKIDTRNVPAAVREAFHKTFSEVKGAQWEIEKGNYEAGFTQNGQKISVTFDKAGTWLETEKEISVKALPAAANVYIEKNCKGKSVKEAAIIKKAGGETVYEAHVQRLDYLFDENGKFLKTE